MCFIRPDKEDGVPDHWETGFLVDGAGKHAVVAAIVDILDHHRAIGGSIGLPQLLPVGAVVCCEEDGVSDHCEGLGPPLLAGSVRDLHRAIGGPVALPDIPVVGAAGHEVEGVADGSHVFAATVSIGALDDVLDHHRAGGGPVAPPQIP